MALELEKLVTKLEADIEDFRKGFKEAADLAKKESDKIESAAGGASKGFKELAKSAAFVATEAAALGGVLAIVTKRAIDNADEVAKMSKQLGLSTDLFQELSYAASQLKVEQGTLNATLGIFNRTIGQAASGSKEANDSFAKLGISVRDSSGHLKTTDQLLKEVSDSLVNVGSTAEKAALLTEVFGRSGAQLIPMLGEGSAKLEEFQKKARDLGVVISADLIRGADEAKDKMETFSRVLDAQVSTAVLALAPLIGDISTVLTSLAAAAGQGYTQLKAMFSDSNADAKAKLLADSIALLNERMKSVQEGTGVMGTLNSVLGTTDSTVANLKERIAAYQAELDKLNETKQRSIQAEGDHAGAIGATNEATLSALELLIQQEEFEKEMAETRENEFNRLVERNTMLRDLNAEAYQEEIAQNQAKMDAIQAQEEGLTDFKLRMLTRRKSDDEKAKAAEDKREKDLAQDRASTLNWISGLQHSKSKEMAAVGKAAAIAQTTIGTYEAAQKAFSSLAGIPIVGPVLGGIAAAAAVAAGLSRVAAIAGTDVGFNQGVDRVPGLGSRDTVPAMLTPGERVVTRDTNAVLERFLQNWEAGGGMGGSARVELIFREDAIQFIEARLIERGRLGISLQAA